MSTVNLYYTDQMETYPSVNRHWELIPNNLFIVDDIADYLATKSKKTVTLQYIKNELELALTIDNSQVNAQPRNMLFRYVSIQNTGESGVYYYFVKNVVWRSKSAIRLELVMDVLNTFKEGTDYEFKSNTKISREHKDRYILDRKLRVSITYNDIISSGTFNEGDSVTLYDEQEEVILRGTCIQIDNEQADIQITDPVTEEEYREHIEDYLDTPMEIVKDASPLTYLNFTPSSQEDFFFQETKNYFRKIDFVSEGINPILVRNDNVSNIEDTGILNQNWYLLYRNTNDPDPNNLVNPVECYLIPENATKTDAAVISGGRLVPSWLEENKWYAFRLGSGQTVTLSNGVSISYNASVNRTLVLTKASNKICVIAYGSDSSDMSVYWQYDDISYVTFTVVPTSYNVFTSLSPITRTILQDMTFPYSFNTTDDTNSVDSIKDLDRADAKNIKCIKLPYCPYRLSYTGDKLLINGSTDWERASFSQSLGGDFFALHLLNKSLKFENEIAAYTSTPFTDLKQSSLTPGINDTRKALSYLMESKLFHSDFYTPSYVYDSFSIKVDLEKCDLDWYIENGVSNNKVKFTMTSTINSKFMFTISKYHSNRSTSNFYKVMPIARNNEMVLYNVPYINYIRTGYNYDIKNKNVNLASNIIGLGLSTGSFVAAMAMPSAPLKAAAVVGAVVSMAMSVKNTIVSTMQSEENIKQKLNQTANQAASVSGSDDVDLMSEYCDNRLKYMVYEPTPVMKNLLNDLFFYAGYKSDRMGLPNHNTRCNFDYLECDASFENLGSIPNDCLNELINAFKNGVTYLHKTTRTSNKVKWDFRQEYENWEKSLL